ncbi:MAG: nucleoside triphosphate pyrophosphohydrolase [Sphaerochaetaceae bacterium]|nr:nucleoside triphosphate pyrophosphohydrolase [Sphaerochaetaceae bacterium]
MINFDIKRKDTLLAALSQLKEITELLRSENGCPWDKKQTNKDFAIYLIDETYEYIDGINKKDLNNISEELGDMFTNIIMLLTIHQEYNDINLLDSINEVCEKLIRRHPHVFNSSFSNDKPLNSDQVIDIWDSVKKNVENRHDDKLDFFKKVPKSLPQLEYSFECMKKVSKVGFDWDNKDDVAKKILEELDEVKEADINQDRDSLEVEIGDLLLSVINYSRYLKIRPEVALRRSTNKFKERFNDLKEICDDKKIPITPDNVDELNRVWDSVKKKNK